MTPPWLLQLAPDRAPPPLGWWPPAPGWWMLAGLLLTALAIGVWWRRRPRRPAVRRWRRAALRELAQWQAAAPTHPSADAALAQAVQQLLRRYAVARYGRETVAALNGDAWIAFVVGHGGSAWAGETGRQLLRCAYGGGASTPGTSATDRERWLAGARGFLKASR